MEDLEFEIEKGIPIPRRTNKRPNEASVFGQMNVGDSIWIPDDKRYRIMQKQAHTHGSRNGKKFICRIEGEGGRIWRNK